MRTIITVGKGFLALCLPLLLITSNLRWAVNNERLYEYGFDKYQVTMVTGLSESELKKVASSLIDYFNFRRGTAQVTILKEGKEFELFTEREIVHLRDIRGLIQLDYHVQLATLVLVVVFGLILLIWQRGRDWRRLTGAFLWGSVLTLGLTIILALGSLLAFDQLFLVFHLLGFPNDYWVLDPSQHYLIMMFPQEFFYEAALFILGATMVEALIVGGIAFGVRKLKGFRGCRCYN